LHFSSIFFVQLLYTLESLVIATMQPLTRSKDAAMKDKLISMEQQMAVQAERLNLINQVLQSSLLSAEAKLCHIRILAQNRDLSTIPVVSKSAAQDGKSQTPAELK